MVVVWWGRAGGGSGSTKHRGTRGPGAERRECSASSRHLKPKKKGLEAGVRLEKSIHSQKDSLCRVVCSTEKEVRFDLVRRGELPVCSGASLGGGLIWDKCSTLGKRPSSR